MGDKLGKSSSDFYTFLLDLEGFRSQILVSCISMDTSTNVLYIQMAVTTFAYTKLYQSRHANFCLCNSPDGVPASNKVIN